MVITKLIIKAETIFLLILSFFKYRGVGKKLGGKYFKFGYRNRGLLRLKELSSYEPILNNTLATIGIDYIFIDVGANVGILANIAATNPNCQLIVAYEPSTSFNELAINCSNSGSLNAEIFISKTAIGSYNGFCSMSQSVNAALDKIDELGTTTKIVKPENIKRHFKEGVSTIVKFDIEGAELSIDWNLFLSLCPVDCIIIETWDHKFRVELEHILEQYGYSTSVYDGEFTKKVGSSESSIVNIVGYKAALENYFK